MALYGWELCPLCGQEPPKYHFVHYNNDAHGKTLGVYYADATNKIVHSCGTKFTVRVPDHFLFGK